MKWFTCILLSLYFGFQSYGNQKTITFKDGITICFEDELLKTSEFQNKSNIINIDDICFIDNKPVFGTIGIIPKTKLKNAYVSINNNIIKLDISYMYEPNLQLLNEKSFKIIRKNDTYIISGLFSDGAYSFVVQWIIIGNTSFRSIISNKEALIINLMYK